MLLQSITSVMFFAYTATASVLGTKLVLPTPENAGAPRLEAPEGLESRDLNKRWDACVSWPNPAGGCPPEKLLYPTYYYCIDHILVNMAAFNWITDTSANSHVVGGHLSQPNLLR